MRRDFDAAPHTRARGSLAEEEAAAWLTAHGYRILKRNVDTPAGEIDVVARDGETLCFIEVKARSTTRYGPAIAAVDRRKQTRLARCASLYLVDEPWDGPCRFDVLGMDPADDGGWTYTLIRDAFGV